MTEREPHIGFDVRKALFRDAGLGGMDIIHALAETAEAGWRGSRVELEQFHQASDGRLEIAPPCRC